jgi:hypothetical protein
VGITENALPAVLAGMLAVHLKKGNAPSTDWTGFYI